MSICSLMRKPYVTLKTMKRTLLKRRSLWITALSFLLLGGLVLGIRSARVADPEYKGRHLSEWMRMVRDDPVLSAHDPRSQEAIQIIREMGTNALPSLLDWMSYQPPLSPYAFNPVFKHLPSGAISSPLLRWGFENEERQQLADKAALVLGLLGPAAAPAIPELVHLAESRARSASTPTRAMCALATLGPPAIPFFQQQLSNPETASPVTWYALERFGTNAKPLIPLLIKGLQHTNRVIVWYSANTLGTLKLQPELVVPALINSLHDQRAATRCRAASTLEKFDALAESALPALTNCLKDPDSDVRAIAAEAIQIITRATLTSNTPRIAPEASTNALSH